MAEILRRLRLLVSPRPPEPMASAAMSGRPAAFVRRLARLLAGGLCWGVMMALSALFSLYVGNGLRTEHAVALTLLYFIGGLLAWAPALAAAGFCAPRRRPTETRFAAYFLALAIGTLSVTAFLFALDYRDFYARWHAPFGSAVWMFQFAFTSASAGYQFAILGSRLFLPLGLPFLLATSLYLARRPH